MDDVKFGDSDLQLTTGAMNAVIDSGNTSIQLPHSQFEILKANMMSLDPSIKEQHLDDEHETILVSSKHCS